MLPTSIVAHAPALTLAEAAMLPAQQGTGETEKPKNLLIPHGHLRFQPVREMKMPRQRCAAGRAVLHGAGIMLPGIRVR